MNKRKTCKCNNCEKEISLSNIKKHEYSCKDKKLRIKIENSWLQKNGLYKCPICDKEYKKVGIATHIWRSHGSGDLHKPCLGKTYKLGQSIWNKGLTKDSSEIVKLIGEKNSIIAKESYKNGTRVPSIMGKDARKRLSKRMSLHNPGSKCKWYEIDGIKVQGTYELQFARALNEQKIKWIKCNKILKYIGEDNKQHSYSPDFYIPIIDLYIEIKGFWWGKDKEIMEYVKKYNNNIKLIILFGKDKLDYICKDILNNLKQEQLWNI